MDGRFLEESLRLLINASRHLDPALEITLARLG